MTRRAHRPQMIAKVVALFAVLLPTLLALWPPPVLSAGGLDPLSLDRVPPRVGPVGITVVNSLLLWSAREIPRATITAQNVSGTRVDAEVWWILSRIDDHHPWTDALAESRHVRLTLSAHASKAVIAAGLTAPHTTPGFYRLSVWSHTFDKSSQRWVHSDGRQMRGNIEVLAPSNHIDHQRQTSRSLFVYSAASTGDWRDGRAARLRVQIANGTAQTRSVTVSWSLRSVATVEQRLGNFIERSGVASVTASAGALTSIEVPLGQLHNTGAAPIVVVLKESTPAGDLIRDITFVRPSLCQWPTRCASDLVQPSRRRQPLAVARAAQIRTSVT